MRATPPRRRPRSRTGLLAASVLLTLLPAIAPPASSAPPPAARGRTTPELILGAERAGAIGHPRAILLLALALAAPDRVPDHLRGDRPWEGTPVMRRIERELPSMPRGRERSRVEALLAGTGTCGFSTTPMTHTRLTPHFFIEYNPMTLGGGLTIDDYAASLERSWEKEVGSFGWAAPPVLEANPPPGGRYHVRIEAPPLVYGFVSTAGTHAGPVGDNPSTPWNDGDAHASCMGLNHDYSLFPGTPRSALDATTAHEFNHSIQYGYGALHGPNAPDDVFAEGGATWMEDEVHDGSNDNRHYLWPSFHESMGAYPDSPYAYWITWRGITERYGTGRSGGGERVMQRFWELTSRNDGSNLAAMDRAVRAEGTTLASAFHAYAVAAAFVEGCGAALVAPYCFEEAAGYRDAAGATPRHGSFASVPGTYEGSVEDDHAINWVSLPASGGAYDVRVANTSDGGRLRASVVCDEGSRLSVLPVERTLSAGTSGGVARVDPSPCSAVVAVVTSASRTAANPAASPSRSYTVSTAIPAGGATVGVATAGRGRGRVSSSPSGIDCGDTCARVFSGGRVRLRATPGRASRFVGWRGACSGTGACAVSPSRARSVVAIFDDERTPPTRPRVIGPRGRFQRGERMRVRWSARDAGSGIATFDVQYRRASSRGGFGRWRTWRDDVASRSAAFRTSPGSTVCFRARATDVAGNRSRFGRARCTAVPLDDASFGRRGAWRTARSSSHFGGSVSRTSERGVRLVSGRVVARRFAILGTTCPRCGRLVVLWNGRRIAGVSLRAASTGERRLVAAGELPGLRRGRVTLRVVSSRRRVVIDGLGLSKR